MRCHHCDSDMLLTDCLTEGGAKQTWYHCPVCAAEQTTSQPSESTLRRVGNSVRCSCRWPEDHWARV